MTFTPQQRAAIETTGRSVIVSAAAGSGKTAVLAERCAFLVCDAPETARCNVDGLLVVTFTDAAAAEMRQRIVAAIGRRAADRPADQRLARQMALIDSAHVSTIHAFCLWLVRRWFSELGLDPTAGILDPQETELLKHETLEALCAELYAAEGGGDRSLDGAKRDLGRRFVRLVDDYGLGDDRELGLLVRRLHDFCASLPDPESWLSQAAEALYDGAPLTVLALAESLRTELTRQAEYCRRLAAGMEGAHAVTRHHADQARAYCDQLTAWMSALAGEEKEPDIALQRLDTVRQSIAGFEFDSRRGPRLAREVDEEVRKLRDRASDQWSEVKRELFKSRLRDRFALFTTGEFIDGLRRTAPYAATLVDVVRRFGEAYAARKRGLDALDFADLERFAYQLLCDGGPDQPSRIARTLHRRFAYVLVDEFQDINPIQQAILRLASREVDPERADNLFVVGDVKQSIYRFRLAEPAVFQQRAEAFGRGAGGLAIPLQTNFRSRPEILDFVNLLFRRLMRRDTGDLVYDADVELRAGRELDADAPACPVEVHLLERSWTTDDDAEEGEALERRTRYAPSRWSPIEREACLIATRIRGLRESPRGVAGAPPPAYRDMVVLLRAARVSAESVAGVLQAMGIPAYADAGGSLLRAREIRDVLAALEVLDNAQQDIPLAAVLRSGVFGERLSEDELVRVRCLDRDIPFHAAARAYAERGVEPVLREKVQRVMRRVRRFRDAARRRPLAEVLWEFYERHGFLAYVGGLPHGPQRRANLLKLHELARRFGTFRRQGLFRFLRFLESLAEEERTLAAAPSLGESDDVVRVMSVHQSKGLEFDIVFLAGLGTRFNLGDRRGRIIFERHAKLGLRVVDAERMIEYPSAAHTLVVDEVERTTREEELRILYVALTRARERLFLVGSKKDVAAERGEKGAGGGEPTAFEVARAATPLDWILPVVGAAPPGVVQRVTGGPADERAAPPRGAAPLIELYLHGPAEMEGWRVENTDTGTDADLLGRVARGDPLPGAEPVTADDPVLAEVRARMDYVYPHLSAATARAAMGVSELKRTYDVARDPGEIELPAPVPTPPGGERVATLPNAPSRAARRGIVTHRVLQHLDFDLARDERSVLGELTRLLAAGMVTAEERELLDADALAWFVGTPLAGAIREAGAGYRRELPYTALEAVASLDPTVGPADADCVLVRGIVDGILPVGECLELVDFKTDAVAAPDVPLRAQRYEPQMRCYARAVSGLWRRPVAACWLVFLAPRELLKLTIAAA